MKSIDKFVLVLVASLALLLAGCGGGSSTPATPPAPQPTAYEMALGAINTATTPEDAQAAYDAVKDDVTAAEGEQLQMAVDNRQAALAMMARADTQKMELMNAAGMVDTSDLSDQDKVDAARIAIARLRQAIADAVDVADTSMYESQLATAIAAVDEAQGGIDTATRRTNQMAELSGASMTLQAALAALSGSTPSQKQLDDANAAVRALNAAIAAGADLTDDEKATYVREAANAAAPINTAQLAFNDAQEKAQEKTDMEMAAMATKLYTAIGTNPLARNGTTPATVVASDTGVLTVATFSADGGTAGPISALEEDKTAMVAPLHDWTGSMHTKTEPTTITDGSLNPNRGTYTANMYSNQPEPTPGLKFGANDGTTGAVFSGGGQTHAHTLTGGRLPTTASTFNAADVMGGSDFPAIGVDRSTLTKDGEGVQVTDALQLEKSYTGTYAGVAGEYYCTGVADATCIVTKTDTGFTLAGSGVWSFEPTDPNARVMSTPTNTYAYYGWWLYEGPDGAIVSAFHGYRGSASTLSLGTLSGTATYKGGAAGKYAIRSGTTNDSGHFTADAELTATFGTTDTISGTIDKFMGADGMSRDWSVELKSSDISGIGAIAPGTTATGGTAWTMGGTADSTSGTGSWSGQLYEADATSGVPQVGTGIFHSEYGNSGRMVGAFGVELEE